MTVEELLKQLWLLNSQVTPSDLQRRAALKHMIKELETYSLGTPVVGVDDIETLISSVSDRLSSQPDGQYDLSAVIDIQSNEVVIKG